MRTAPPTTPPDARAAGELAAAGWVVAVALALTLALAAPVLLAPTERIPGREIVGRHHDAYNFIGQAEYALNVRYHAQPLTDWPGRLLGAAVGGVGAYNLVVLLTFPLTALTVFLLGRHLGLGRPAAAFAGLVFAFSPFHIAHAAYHPHIVQLQWIPLFLLALWRAMDRWSAGAAALLLVSSAALVLANFYHFLIAVCVTPVALVAYWLVGPRRGARLAARDPLLTGGTLAAIAAAGVGYVVVVAPRFLDGWGRDAAEYEDLFVYSARLWSYLVPPVDHWLARGPVERFWAEHPLRAGMVEHQLYAGLGLLALAGVALWSWARGARDTTALRSVPVLGAVALGTFVCSLPPVVELGPIELPTPSALFYPVLTVFRAYARTGAVVLLMVALLAAIGLARLVARGGRSRRLGLALLAVVAIDYTPFPPWRWHDVLPTTAHRWLAEQPGPMQIMDCAQPTFGDVSVTDLMPHPTAVLGVFSRRADHPHRRRRFWVDDAMLDPVRPLSDCAEPGLAGKLAALGYTHLLVRADYPLREHVPQEGLAPLREFEDAEVFTVRSPPARVYVGEIEGLSWRASSGRRTLRWLTGTGRFHVVNATESPLSAELAIELSAFHRERLTEVALDDRPAASVLVGTEPGEFLLGPLELPPGTSTLELRPIGEPLVPARVLGSEDTRPLTIAVGHWRWILPAEEAALAD